MTRGVSNITAEAWNFDRQLTRAIDSDVSSTSEALAGPVDARKRIADRLRQVVRSVNVSTGVAHKRAYADARETVEGIYRERDFRVFSSALSGPIGRAVARQLKEDAQHDQVWKLYDSPGVLRPEIRDELIHVVEPGTRFQIVQNHSLELAEHSVRRNIERMQPKTPLAIVLEEWRAWLRLEAILYWVHSGTKEPLDHPDIAIDILDSGLQDGMDKVFRYGELHPRRLALCDVDIPTEEVLSSFQRGTVVRSMSEQNAAIVRAEHRIWAGCQETCYDEAVIEESPHVSLRDIYPGMESFEDFADRHTRLLWHDADLWAVHIEEDGRMQPWPNADLATTTDPRSGHVLGEMPFFKATVGCPLIPGQGIRLMTDFFNDVYSDPLLMTYAYETHRDLFVSQNVPFIPLDPEPRSQLPATNSR